MKFTVRYGNFFLFFALLWIFLLGNYHLYTHYMSGISMKNGGCTHGILFATSVIAIMLGVIIGIGGLLWIFSRDFWNKEIDLDKFDKK